MDALTAIETRVLGGLLEKAVTTPDQYPLSVNAIRAASNQKSSREPVMDLSEGEVLGALRSLETKLLVSADPNLRGRTEKYLQRFCKPPFGIYDFNDGQYAVLTVLMLRGPATPGELRTRTDRMHKFSDNNAVVETLNSLHDWTPDPLVVELPKAPNRRDSCWAQLFGENAEDYRAEASSRQSRTTMKTDTTSGLPQGDEIAQRLEGKTALSEPARLAVLESRVSQLETAVAELQKALGN